MSFLEGFKKEFWRIDLKVYGFLTANGAALALIFVYALIQLVPFWLLSKYLNKLYDEKGWTPQYCVLMVVRWFVLAPLAYFLFYLSWYGLYHNQWGLLAGAAVVAASIAIKDGWRI